MKLALCPAGTNLITRGGDQWIPKHVDGALPMLEHVDGALRMLECEVGALPKSRHVNSAFPIVGDHGIPTRVDGAPPIASDHGIPEHVEQHSPHHLLGFFLSGGSFIGCFILLLANSLLFVVSFFCLQMA